MKRDPLPPLDGVLANVPPVMRARAWRRSLWMLVLVVAGILSAYGTTGYHIVEIWSRSETFAHGFVVPLIVAWLIWRARHSWMTEIPSSSPVWVLPLAGCGFAWFCGELATVNAVSQLAFVGMLVCAVPLVLGTHVARRIAFPLAFLFFAVPIGEFMLPALMQWTADFTVYALRLTGVPVYQEGQQIVIPSGRWSVVEACSGIRYLIASSMVGTLYAYLSFSSLWRRMAFIGLAIAIPIVANWIRAYLIVMIGHLSSNRLAVGVDHIVYGWLFFGLVMFLMFWAGSFWREDVPAAKVPREPSAAAVRAGLAKLATGPLLALTGLCIAVWPLALHSINARVESPGPVALERISNIGAWHARDGELDSWQPVIQSPSAEVRQIFSSGAREVGIHVAFFRDQSHGRKLVSSTNVLAAAGAANGVLWSIVSRSSTTIKMPARTFTADQEELAGPGDQRLIALRWYWVDGRMTSSDSVAKLYTFLSRMQGRDDGAIVIVYSRAGADARRTLDAFLRDVGPALDRTLERAAAAQ